MSSDVKIVQFGSYRFSNVVSATSNFGAIHDAVTSLPDSDGVYDNQGSFRGKQKAGRVEAELYLEAEDSYDMRRQKDRVLGLISQPPRPLWYQPDDPRDPVRWCRARALTVDLKEDSANSECLQRVSITWSVTFPRWFSRPNPGDGADLLALVPSLQGLASAPTYYFDYHFDFGDGDFIPERVSAQITSGSKVYIANLGNATTPLRLEVMPSRPWFLSEGLSLGDPGVMIGAYGSTSLSNLVVRRRDYESNLILEQFSWSSTLALNERLVVDSFDSSITWYHFPSFNETGYTHFTNDLGTGFISLDPGINIIEVVGTFDGPFGFLILDYDDAWI